MKASLFLGRGRRSRRGSRGRSRSSFWLALFLHFATATAARRATARATAAALMSTTAALATTAAFAAATTAHRPAAAATTAAMREKAAEAATETTTVATAARLAASIAAWSTSAAAATTTTAAVASEPESIGGARNGQYGHHQSNTLKVHLPISNVYTFSLPPTSPCGELRIVGRLDKRRSRVGAWQNWRVLSD